MLELLAKLKEAAKVPDHAVRRVKRLDEIIATLRRNRAEVAANILADECVSGRGRELDLKCRNGGGGAWEPVGQISRCGRGSRFD